MSRRKGSRPTMEIFSVFGQLEAVAATIMIEKGEASKIEAQDIPASAAVNKLGQRAQFAVMMPATRVGRFERLIADLRL